MGRKIYVASAARLSLANNSVSIHKKDDEILSFPLEDIDLVFIEDPNAVVTASLITAAASFGTSIVFCGRDYLPIAQCTPRNSHYRKSKLLHLQLDLLPYKKKKLWERIVRAKIRNQINVIRATIDDQLTISRLTKYYENVKPGDEDNMEGVAAREYFSCLFGDDFIRFSKTNPISAALNYGYGILASQVIRQVAFSGLDDNIGIWHEAQENAYNLSYDLIEPFRQIVDYFLCVHRKELDLPLQHDFKVAILNLLDEGVKMKDRICKASFAIETEVESFVESLNAQDASKLLLPEYDPSFPKREAAEEE